MLVLSMYCSKDRHQVEKQARWIAELGGCKNHDLFVARDKSAEPVKELVAQFRSAEEIVISNDVWKNWTHSPQNAFRQAARYIEYKYNRPWLNLEPDAIPLKRGWLDTLEKEYLRARKPFMGAFVPGIHGAPDHLSGVAIYPGELVAYAGDIYIADLDIPWDLVCPEKILPNAHCTDLIQHKWDRDFNNGKPEPHNRGFKTLEEFRAVTTTECVLFHADKTWSIPDLIRPLMGGGGQCEDKGTPKQSTSLVTGGLSPLPAQPMAADSGQKGVEQLPPSSNDPRAEAANTSGTLTLSTMEDVRRNVEALSNYASDGFARMRVMKELKRVGLTPKGKRK